MSLRSDAVKTMEAILREKYFFQTHDNVYCIDCGARQDTGKPSFGHGWHTDACRIAPLLNKPYGIMP